MDSVASTSKTKPSRVDMPMWLRGLVRRSEFALICVAVLIGGIAGVCVALIRWAVAFQHRTLFGAGPESSLSAMDQLTSHWTALVPALGGLFLGLTGILILKWRPRRPIDPIEANALQGGRMSLVDSILLSLQVVVSSGVGGSVGLEAGFTQIGSGLASVIGSALKLRRSDMRTLVGCGAAGAIGAAFGAPLTGAFYAFELIVGTYTPFGLAPIIASSISAVLVVRALGFKTSIITHIPKITSVTQTGLAELLILSLICALIGIGVMRAVTFVEFLFKRSRMPLFLQPVIGGLALGAMALVTPKILSSGHGGLYELFATPVGALSLQWLALVVLMKAAASSISIGSGFRGGLFFASLFLGGMVGRMFAMAVPLLAPHVAADAAIYGIVGMSAMAVAIIGGPLTMSFLAMESTGNLPVSVMVLISSAVVSVVVRQIFGYSFATWRLHLRGESIRSAHDVGWIRALTVARMMRPDVKTVIADETVAEFVEAFPLGSTQWVVVTDASERYAGMISVTEAHLSLTNGGDAKTPVGDLISHQNDMLQPSMNIKHAAALFERSESEALAVIDDPLHRRVVGLLTEAHVLRRYTEELDKARSDLAGEKWLGEA